MLLPQTETTTDPGANIPQSQKEQDFYKQVESVRDQAREIIHSLPKTISVETITPPSPNDFYACPCLSYRDGGFIAERPKSTLNQDMIMSIMGYGVPRWNSGAVLYTRVKGWSGLDDIEIVYQAEEKKDLLF